MEEKSVVLVPCHQPAEGFQPAAGVLDDPAFAITPEWSAVLVSRTNAVLAMRTVPLDAALGQTLAKRIAIGGLVVDRRVANRRGDRLVEQRPTTARIGLWPREQLSNQRLLLTGERWWHQRGVGLHPGPRFETGAGDHQGTPFHPLIGSEHRRP